MNRASPLILNFDDSVGGIAGAQTIELGDWQEAIRFGCTLSTFARLRDHLDAVMPTVYSTVLMGSGDYHHLTWPLVERQRERGPFQVVVFDNHPDNMRFPWGIHCGSWVRKVAALTQVSHVHVVGITSGDISARHAWENYLTPLRQGKLSYWCMDVNIDWAQRLGLGAAFHRHANADALSAAFVEYISRDVQATYLSIDKDAFSVSTARTNWDQGQLEARHADQIIDALHGRIIASDINGEVSAYQYRTWWKRMLSGMDGQTPVPQSELDAWQRQQREFNTHLLARIAAASA